MVSGAQALSTLRCCGLSCEVFCGEGSSASGPVGASVVKLQCFWFEVELSFGGSLKADFRRRGAFFLGRYSELSGRHLKFAR